MPQEVRLPSLGQTSDELRILKWFKAEGDEVRRGEPLLEVETDKATLDVEAALTGTLLKILTQEGEVVQAGRLVAYVGVPGEVVPAVEEDQAVTVRAAPQPEHERILPGLPDSGFVGGIPAMTKVLASPAARQLARTHGVKLDALRGSGPGGRIEKEDVLRCLQDQNKESGTGIAP
jgi:pyruvate dehydrogenase E2 component (dihydrolipoamide acetyltransferase)